jgi:DNA-binding transcriptional regulator LsrR (DeoR family)
MSKSRRKFNYREIAWFYHHTACDQTTIMRRFGCSYATLHKAVREHPKSSFVEQGDTPRPTQHRVA